jgi:DNA repair exonuclease SbcCD nuclease subunit
MLHVVWGSDFHLGLKTDDIDREEEIIGVFIQQIDYIKELLDKGQKVIYVLGGDIFNRNNPSEDLISRFIDKVINRIKEIGVDAYFVVGNHDSISLTGNTSCLTFIDKIRAGYPNIRLISDITLTKVCNTDFGPLWFSFMPHITRTHLEGTDYKSTQEYIDTKASKIMKRVGPDGTLYAFSHLNVRGAHGGSEENLLKKSEVYLPKCFLEKEDHRINLPEIIQGHIHTRDRINNISIVGSPIYCGFGEGDEAKYFLHLEIATSMGEKGSFNYKLTNCRNFLQLELDLSKDGWDGVDFLSLTEVSLFNETISPSSVVKYDIKINPKNCSVDWEAVRKQIMDERKCYVKPIKPKYIYERIVRSEKQTVNLSPKDAVKVWLKTNKPPRAKEKFKLAQTYLQDGV